LVKRGILLLALGLILCFFSCSGEGDEIETVISDFPGMGVGVNIGNTLDCIGTDTWTAGETGWGNPKITREFVKALKSYGYKTVRLPVTWAERMGPGPDYTIDKAWMDRVAEVVNWILEEGMYCILNLHHDGGEADKSWILGAATDRAGVSDRFSKVWKQIAVRFRSVSANKLIFESMNEVGFRGDKSTAYEILNGLNQTFVNTVRADGSANATRPLLIAGYYTDINDTCDARFLMPQDTQEGKLLLSIHYYTPSTFCIAEETNNSWGFKADWGSPATATADNAELTRQFDKLKTRFIDNGVKIIIGEYGVTKKNKVEEGRIRWMTAVTQACLDYGMCPVLWDTGGEISRNSPYTMSPALQKVLKNLKPPSSEGSIP
jgi:endoglucanase